MACADEVVSEFRYGARQGWRAEDLQGLCYAFQRQVYPQSEGVISAVI